MSPGALAGSVFFAGGREGFVEVCGEALVAFELGDGAVVGDVEDAGEFPGGEVEGGGGGVGNVDLVEDALAGFLDDGGALEEFAKDDAAAGAVKSGEAGDGATGLEDDLLGFEEELGGFADGLGGGGFGDFGAIGLVIDGGAGGEDEVGVGKGMEEVLGAFDEDVAVGFGAAAS